MKFTIKHAALLTLACSVLPSCSINNTLSEDTIAPRYTPYVEESLNNLMEFGTDRYGSVHSPMLVTILDNDSKTSPKQPKKLDGYYRATRLFRRSPAGSNFLTDQPTIKAFHALSTISGDEKYTSFANSYADYFMENLTDEQGFFWWGWHRYYDVYDEKRKGIHFYKAKWGTKTFPHEIHSQIEIHWDKLWQINPKAVTAEMDAIWQWHVFDKNSGEINRHGDGLKGCDFTISGGSYINAFAFMYAKTKDDKWLNRAKLIADYYWQQRNPKTNLLPERPNARKRFDGSTFTTTVTGVHSFGLLKAYELTGDESFKQYAHSYLTAYAKYGYDQHSGKFWGALKLDGTPISGPRVYTDNVDSPAGYLASQPRGHLDLWEPYILGYQYGIYTAQMYAYAYQLTKDPQMLKNAKRFAKWIEQTPPGTPESKEAWYRDYSNKEGKQGTYAGKYGRSISFLLHLFTLTGEKPFLDQAVKLADESVDKLFYKGLFKGHPAKPYYEATDGVGYLLYALLQLDQVLQAPNKIVAEQTIKIGKNNVVMPLDNW
ncbi:glycoside hydrolase family 76 protein [Algibacillus agarilyticus]|uniref:glycoside hydrolase family 76 protein n=1 Tax=Algibacillus agarilyticus TaxID=2234133 RepID=UPI000DD0CEE3|nr:glycoside hydrolase family 76 protein [Algibacillus agarilyticus]